MAFCDACYHRSWPGVKQSLLALPARYDGRIPEERLLRAGKRVHLLEVANGMRQPETWVNEGGTEGNGPLYGILKVFIYATKCAVQTSMIGSDGRPRRVQAVRTYERLTMQKLCERTASTTLGNDTAKTCDCTENANELIRSRKVHCEMTRHRKTTRVPKP